MSSFGKDHPFTQARVNLVAKGFDPQDYDDCLKDGVHERFDELDREENYAQVYSMLADDEVIDRTFCSGTWR